MVHRDVYLHGRAANEILQTGHTSFGGYALWWPGAFVVWSSFMTITRLDIPESTLLLTLAMCALAAILLYLTGRRIHGERLGSVAGILYLSSTIYLYEDFTHFSPALMSFTVFSLILFLSIGVSSLRNPSVRVLFFVATAALVLTHPLAPLFLVAGIGVYIMLSRRRGYEMLPTISILGFSVVLYLVWVLNLAEWSIRSMTNILWLSISNPFGTKLGTVAKNPWATQSMPAIGYFLRDNYFKPLMVSLGLLAFLGYARNRRDSSHRFLGAIFVGYLIASVVLLLSPRFEMGLQLERAMMFVLLPAAFLAVSSFSRSKRSILASLIIVMLLTPSFLATRTYFIEYEYSDHSWEMPAYQFLALHAVGANRIASDSRSLIYYSFFDPRQTDEGVRLSVANLTRQGSEHATFFDGNSTYILRSFRQELTDNAITPSFQERRVFWKVLDSRLEGISELNRTYDDSYIQVYFRKPRSG